MRKRVTVYEANKKKNTKTNIVVNRQGCGQKAGGLRCLKMDLNDALESDRRLRGKIKYELRYRKRAA